jgi:hypothetical protein
MLTLYPGYIENSSIPRNKNFMLTLYPGYIEKSQGQELQTYDMCA